MKAFASALFSSALLLMTTQTSAQTAFPESCASVAGTQAVPAPGSGSYTISSLSKYNNFPANACVAFSGNQMTLVTGGNMNYKLAVAMAVNYNQVGVPAANCAGTAMTLNGGPVYSYVVADGTVNVAPGGQSISGTTNATVYLDVDNLSVTINGATYLVETGLETMRATTTFSGSTSSTRVCLPNGLNSTVNGQPFAIPANLWQCVGGNGQSNVVFVTDC